MLILEINFINIKNPGKKLNSCISIKSKILGKLFKRYKLTKRGKQEIIKITKIRSTTWSGLNRLARKIEFKESIANKNK